MRHVSAHTMPMLDEVISEHLLRQKLETPPTIQRQTKNIVVLPQNLVLSPMSISFATSAREYYEITEKIATGNEQINLFVMYLSQETTS